MQPSPKAHNTRRAVRREKRIGRAACRGISVSLPSVASGRAPPSPPPTGPITGYPSSHSTIPSSSTHAQLRVLSSRGPPIPPPFAPEATRDAPCDAVALPPPASAALVQVQLSRNLHEWRRLLRPEVQRGRCAEAVRCGAAAVPVLRLQRRRRERRGQRRRGSGGCGG
ncbi:hypothetical protein ACQ4PT_025817 [Festuca glaucescens]